MAILTPTSPLTGLSRHHTPAVAPGGLPVAGAILWLDAWDSNTTTTGSSYATGDPVTTWTDHSGAGNDLTCFTTLKPLYYPAVVNGGGAIGFGRATWPPAGFETGFQKSFTLAQPFTYFVAAVLNVPSGNQYMVDGATINTAVFNVSRVSDAFIYAGGTILYYGHAFPDANPIVHTAVFDGANSYINLESATFAYGETGPANVGTATPGGITIGIGADGTTSPYIGGILEFILYPSALTSGQRGLVSAYLRSKWGF